MALSNIFREPRREITESAVGIAFLAAPVAADYLFAVWFRDVTAGMMVPTDPGCPVVLGMVFGVIFGAIAFLGLVLTHALGDVLCNALQARGVHLRPRERR